MKKNEIMKISKIIIEIYIKNGIDIKSLLKKQLKKI